MNKFFKDPIYRNSLFLMLNTAALSGFGFLFWIIATRFFDSTTIGNATALLGAANLMANLGLLGTESGLLRFLPDSTQKERKINSVVILSLISTVITCLIYVQFLEFFSPKLHVVINSAQLVLIFTLIAVFTSLNNILDATFTAFKSSQFVFIRGFTFGILKIALIFAFYSLGFVGLMYSFILPAVFITLAGFIFLILYFQIKPKPAFSLEALLRMSKYSFHNYISGIAGTTIGSILPLIIINFLGAKYAAYFYFSTMVNTALASIPSSSSSSFLAVSSGGKVDIKFLFTKTLKFIGTLVIPAALLLIVFGKFILLAFGKEYALNAYPLLALLAVSTIFSSLNSLSAAFLNYKKRSFLVTKISILYATVLLTGSYLLIKLGLTGIGLAYVSAHLVVNAFYVYYFITNKNLFDN